ncbi:nitrous oxide reductase accessory protein NosL [Aquabacterium sp.]|uniref:nitrous oxide reductase accessory protein NosL n=1 Tax=Aquabacterium sp. TaxID=1872578 RepID=UPI002BDF8F2E|nr:nitrous oxide reductase accessory protein NosL [Aquabacterium sp.]HSW05933.1 nitrous oxide reductase accessory protein NosL [Aquabacterium sp.]
MNFNRRHLLLAACAAPLTVLIGCSQSDAATPIKPAQIDPATTCDLDGMLLADYPGPKAQVHFVGVAAPVFFCDTVEMFATLLRPEQVRAVRAAFVQDMGRADWDKPQGHWIEADKALYIVGSKRHGSMGPTFASFAAEADAKKFASAHGGRLLSYAGIKPDMADLSGGAVHDSRM